MLNFNNVKRVVSRCLPLDLVRWQKALSGDGFTDGSTIGPMIAEGLKQLFLADQ